MSLNDLDVKKERIESPNLVIARLNQMPPQYDRLSGIIIRSNLGAVGCSAAK